MVYILQTMKRSFWIILNYSFSDCFVKQLSHSKTRWQFVTARFSRHFLIGLVPHFVKQSKGIVYKAFENCHVTPVKIHMLRIFEKLDKTNYITKDSLTRTPEKIQVDKKTLKVVSISWPFGWRAWKSHMFLFSFLHPLLSLFQL